MFPNPKNFEKSEEAVCQKELVCGLRNDSNNDKNVLRHAI